MENVETMDRVAGKVGEAVALVKLRASLNFNDYLLTNVIVENEGVQTELDAVVVNENGVFIFEFKNFNGRLYGKEDDLMWERTKTSEAGYEFNDTVRNPIGQLKRGIYMMAETLKKNDIRAFVKGYIYFVQLNSPIKSRYIIDNPKGMGKVIHNKGRNRLEPEVVEKITTLLCREKDVE